MTDFLSLISSIPSLISNFSGSANPYAKQQQQLAGNQLDISNALTQGPSNPLYQSIFGQYKQQNANNLASTIAEAQGQNRMNANLGRTPLFSNERGSENIFRNVVQQQQGAGLQADQQTRAALGQAGNSSLQGLAGYNAITQQNNLATAQNLQGYKDIFSLLRGIGSPNTGSSGAGNYSPVNKDYQDPNAGLFPSNQSYGLNQMQPAQVEPNNSPMVANYQNPNQFGPSGYGMNWMQQ